MENKRQNGGNDRGGVVENDHNDRESNTGCVGLVEGRATDVYGLGSPCFTNMRYVRCRLKLSSTTEDLDWPLLDDRCLPPPFLL